ncbi:MAG: LysM peptidoglycan-binding domain-containing protein [Gorillibacterium sp.]|nr:LysM peptidoglycan-binding domain-containing protein [Gorillibacterium sp.]
MNFKTSTKHQLFKTAVVGTLLLTPMLGAGSALAASYTVKPADTLWKISVNSGVPLQTLIKVNPQIKNPNIIWEGMTVQLPDKSPATSKAPTQPTVAPTGVNVSAYAQQVADLVNKERVAAGLSPLKLDQALSDMALVKAKDMYSNNYFDHTSPTYGSPFDMMTRYGIPHSYAGENIAKGQRDPQEVHTAWMNSAGHRANIMNVHYTKIGVAYYNGEWVQEFTG